MNIFILDENPKICAQSHADKHVVKMILETAQLLCTAVRLCGIEYGYNITHKNHPCAIWARTSNANFSWLLQLGKELCFEYSYRYGKKHKTEGILDNMPINCIVSGKITPFVQAMPDIYKQRDAVSAYRSYYIGEKKNLLIYTNRLPPDWLVGIATYKSP